jgi:hypothetical protein
MALHKRIFLLLTLSSCLGGSFYSTQYKKEHLLITDAKPVNSQSSLAAAKSSHQAQVAALPESPKVKSQEEARLLKIDEQGTRIYQIDGTQVTVTRDGELYFLPAEI